jgi:two-component sensor histidine kinase
VFPGIEDFWVRTYARVVDTGEPAHFEHRLGPVQRWFEVLVYRTAPGRFAALFLNVTERRAAETRRDALIELDDRLRDLRDPAEIARTAAEVIGRALGAARAGYGMVDPAQATFRVERDWTDERVASAAGDWRLADFWTGFADGLRRGEVVAVDDVSRDLRTAGRAESYLAEGVRAFINAPVVEAGQVTAILYVQATTPRCWLSEEVGFVRDAAERAWAAARRVRADTKQALLLAELNHRVKNTLAVVQSLAAQTARGAADLPAFLGSFQARLFALARAHDLLSREQWEGAALNAVVRAALDPLAVDEACVDLSGCASAIVLPPTSAVALTMALHELATNALKHGALSVAKGRVSIACETARDDGTQVVEWVERGGPPIAGLPVRRGFGLRLLGRGLASEASIGVDIRFEPEGVRCTLRLPPKGDPG